MSKYIKTIKVEHIKTIFSHFFLKNFLKKYSNATGYSKVITFLVEIKKLI